MSPIENIRENIDKIDEQILELLNARAKWALEIKKTDIGKTPIRPERENSIIRRLIDKNKGPLPNSALREIFTELIASFRDQMQLDHPVSVSYLGPAGTYSEEAAMKLFGSTIDLHPEETISDVIRAAEGKSTYLAVVPIENSSEGAVLETHKLLLDTNLRIVAEITLPIVHSLLTNADSLDQIKTVYAHPQALGQCRTWLSSHLPQARKVPASSNSVAAELAASETNAAAIASEKASRIYKLKIVERGINDQPGNETRFIALGTSETVPTGQDKTSIICVLNDKPGALYELLGILAEKNISMTRLESQPFKRGQYAFYIDFLGHQKDDNVRDAIMQIDRHTKMCQILGSYHVEVKDGQI